MKLAWEYFETAVALSTGAPRVLVVENPVALRNLVQDFLRQIAGDVGGLVLSEEGREISIAKNVHFIESPFFLECNGRKVLQKLYQDMERTAYDAEMYQKTQEMRSMVNNYALELLFQSGKVAEIDLDFDIKKLFAALDVHFSCDPTNFLEQIVTYWHIQRECFGTKIFAFAHLSKYVSKEELAELYRQAEYEEIVLILLESSYQRLDAGERLLLLDHEYCTVICDT